MKLRRIVTVILTAVMLFSVPVSVSAFYPVYFSENFTDAGTVYSTFLISNHWILDEEGGLYGDADAKALQTMVTSNPEWREEPIYTYIDYDMTVTLATADDADSDDDRLVSLVYANDNAMMNGVAESRVYMSFAYDFERACFILAAGKAPGGFDTNLLAPLYMDICDDGSEFYTLGMTVERDRIRCFCNGELIFDFIDTVGEYFIADEIDMPAIFWQTGNFVQIRNFSVDRPGYLLQPSYRIGDADSDGMYKLSDVSLIMKHIAKWEGLAIDTLSADVSRDGKITLTDAVLILKTLSWDPDLI